MDTYASFNELRRHQIPGRDFIILRRKGCSRFVIMAPHGGGIEPGTADIADALAGGEHGFYAFKGIKQQGNAILHLTSNRFDEPLGLALARQAQTVVTIHGCQDPQALVYIGGRDLTLGRNIETALKSAGFNASGNVQQALRGRSAANICNRGQSGKGVQLEISRGLRESLIDGLAPGSHRPRSRTPLFFSFIRALRSALI